MVLFLIAAFFAQTLSTASVQSAILSGRLTLPDGRPAPGIRITALEAKPPSDSLVVAVGITATDADGRWRLGNLPPGRYFITAGLVDFPTYYPGGAKIGEASPVAATVGSAVDGINFVLLPVPSFRISGRVIAVDQVLSGNQRVELDGPGGGTPIAVVASDGSFKFEGIRPGSYLATIPPDRLQTFPISVQDKDLVGVELSPRPSVAVSGTVIVDGGGPVPPVALSFSGPVQGTATIRQTLNFNQRFPVGEYRVSLHAPLPSGYNLKSIVAGSTDLLQTPLLLGLDKATPPIVINLGTASPPPWVAVEGSIGTTPSSSDFVPVRVSLSGDSLALPLQATIRPDGSFEFPMVLPGIYSARVIGNLGLRAPAIDVAVPGADSRNVRISLPRFRAIRGKIQVAGGSPVPGVALSFSDPSGVFNDRIPLDPGSDGTFSIAVPEGEFLVSPEAGLYSIASFLYGSTDLLQNSFKATAGSDELRLLMAPPTGTTWSKVSGRVFGTVPNTENLHVILSGAGSRNIEASLGADGQFEFPQVARGNYSLFLSPANNTTTIRIEVGATDVAGIELVIPRTRVLRLQSVMENGGPVPNVQVLIDGRSQILPPRSPLGAATVALPEGEHRISTAALPPGYKVKAFTSGDVDLTREPLRVGPDTLDLRLTLGTTAPQYRVNGRVTGVELTGAGLISFIENRVVFRGDITPQGAFEIAQIPPGNYRVNVTVSDAEHGPYGASLSLIVSDADVTNFEIPLPRLHLTDARVDVEGGTLLPGGFGLQLTGRTGASPLPIRFQQRTNGKLQASLPVGEWRASLASGLPAGYSLKSLTYGTVDLLREPLKIAESDSSEIHAVFGVSAVALRKVSGRVTGLDLASGATLVLNAGGSSVEASVGNEGTFEVTGLPRASYTVTLRSEDASIGSYTKNMIVASIQIRTEDISGMEIAIPREIKVAVRITVDGTRSNAGGALFAGMRTVTTSGIIINGLAVGESSRPLSLPEGEQTIQIQTLARGYAVKSMMYGPVDLLREPLRLNGFAANDIVITVTASAQEAQ